MSKTKLKPQCAFVAYQYGLLMPFTMRCARRDVEHYLVHEYFIEEKPWGIIRHEGWEIRRVRVTPIRAKTP